MNKTDGPQDNRNASPINAPDRSSTLLDNSQDSLTGDDDISSAAEIEDLGRQLSSEVDPIQRLRLIKAVLDVGNAALDGAVPEARGAGGTWQAVAAALGMTRQAAHARWSKSKLEAREDDGRSTPLSTPTAQPTSFSSARSWRGRLGGITLRGSASITVKPRKHQ